MKTFSNRQLEILRGCILQKVEEYNEKRKPLKEIKDIAKVELIKQWETYTKGFSKKKQDIQRLMKQLPWQVMTYSYGYTYSKEKWEENIKKSFDIQSKEKYVETHINPRVDELKKEFKYISVSFNDIDKALFFFQNEKDMAKLIADIFNSLVKKQNA